MKIVRQLGNSKTVIEDQARPVPGPGEVLIKTMASGLCGSEMSSYRSKEGLLDGNFGHEAAGYVEELGSGVETLSVGQRVGVSAIAGCGTCDFCRMGRYTWCNDFKFFRNMHAEFFVIPALACHVLPDDVPWDVGVLITGDGFGVPYHTSRKIMGPDVKTIAIFGLGPVGLSHIVYQKQLGRRVIGIDRVPYRLELAKKLGAYAALSASETVVEDLKKLTNDHGVDIAIEAAGLPVTAKLCFQSVRKGGTVIFNGEQPSVDLSPSDDFIRRDITAVGSWYYFFNEYSAMLQSFRDGMPIGSLITHHFPLDRASEAFQQMADGQSGKIVLTY